MFSPMPRFTIMHGPAQSSTSEFYLPQLFHSASIGLLLVSRVVITGGGKEKVKKDFCNILEDSKCLWAFASFAFE